MHSPEVRQQFVERRAGGGSLVQIAAELGVARSTLIEWSRQLRFELQNQTAIELDDLQNRLLGPRRERAAALADKLAAVEAELKKRDLTQLSTSQLFALANGLRREIVRETAGGSFAVPVKDIPGGEYIEEIQQWKP